MFINSYADVSDFSAILRVPQNGGFAIFSNTLDHIVTVPLTEFL